MWVNVATVAPHADHWMAESLQQATSLGAPGSHLPAIPLASGGGSRAQKRFETCFLAQKQNLKAVHNTFF